jgi:iron complex transport system permease protein
MRRHNVVLSVLLLSVILAFALSLVVGSVAIPLSDVARVVLGGEASRESWTTIVQLFRLPKALTALIAGAALAVSGLQMQTLFRNPLADPYVLGVSSGASLGVAAVVLGAGAAGSALLPRLGIAGSISLVLSASIGAAMVFAMVMLIARHVRNLVTLLVAGLMVGYITSAFVSLLIYLSAPAQVQVFIAWTFGSFGGVTWQNLAVFAPTMLLALVTSFASAKSLNALLLGETYAHSLGVNVRRARLLTIGASSLIAGAVTAFCGPIGFLGIAVPHVARSLLRSAEHRALIPACVLIGAIVALIADVLTQLPGGVTLPLNVIMALFGAPFVLSVLLRRR